MAPLQVLGKYSQPWPTVGTALCSTPNVTSSDKCLPLEGSHGNVSTVGEGGELPAGAKFSIAGAPRLPAGREAVQSRTQLPYQGLRLSGILPAVTLYQPVVVNPEPWPP